MNKHTTSSFYNIINQANNDTGNGFHRVRCKASRARRALSFTAIVTACARMRVKVSVSAFKLTELNAAIFPQSDGYNRRLQQMDLATYLDGAGLGDHLHTFLGRLNSTVTSPDAIVS